MYDCNKYAIINNFRYLNNNLVIMNIKLPLHLFVSVLITYYLVDNVVGKY